jgi:hypothetical protein
MRRNKSKRAHYWHKYQRTPTVAASGKLASSRSKIAMDVIVLGIFQKEKIEQNPFS